MISADVAFRLAANAAAAAWSARPAFVSYRTDVVVDVPRLRRHKVISRAVETRTADDRAVIQDLPRGQRQVAQSFPLIPTFDAISYFRIEFNGNFRDTLSYVKQLAPITFKDPRQSSTADVVVTSLRYYHASYAADSNDGLLHILMDPLKTLTNHNDSDFYLHDLYVNPATNLPVRVTYAGPDTDFSCDYQTIDNHWLITHISYARTTYGPLRLGRLRFTVDATNSGFTFPTTAADPQLGS